MREPEQGGRDNSATRSAALNGGALATVALGSAIQVALYLRDFGATHRTDGVIAAIAVYSLVVVLGQLLRTTAVPLLSGDQPILSGTSFAWGMAAIVVVVTIVCAGLAPIIADVIAGASGPTGRHVATEAMRIMAPAIGLQLAGSGMAVHGAVRDRLDAVSLAFIASSIAGLIGFFALRTPSAELVLAWANLVGSLGLVAALAPGMRVSFTTAPGLRAVGRSVKALLTSIPLPASFVVMYPISLALAPSDRPGQITLFGLAFTACSYLSGFTGQALSMADAVVLSRLDSGAVQARRAMVIRAFRYSALLAAPGLGIAAVAGTPIVRALLPAASSGSDSYWAVDMLLLAPWLLASLGQWSTLPAFLSVADWLAGRRLAGAVVALVLVHVAAALIGRAIWGFDGIVVAMAVAPAVFVAAALRAAAPGAAGQLLLLGAIVTAVTAVSFGGLELIARGIAQAGPVTGIVAALIGAGVYAALVALAFPDAARTMVRMATRR